MVNPKPRDSTSYHQSGRRAGHSILRPCTRGLLIFQAFVGYAPQPKGCKRAASSVNFAMILWCMMIVDLYDETAEVEANSPILNLADVAPRVVSKARYNLCLGRLLDQGCFRRFRRVTKAWDLCRGCRCKAAEPS